MSDTPQQPATGTEPTSACPLSGGRSACPCTKWLPLLLLAAAAFLYVRDMRSARQRTDAANLVRSQVAQPIGGVAVSHLLEGRTIPFIVRCPVNVASNLLVGLSHAEPTRFPKGEVEGDEFEIHLIQTNSTATILRAVRLASDPEALYVGVRQPVGPTAAPAVQGKAGDKQAGWTVSMPAKVPGAGALVGEILGNIQKAAEKLPPDAELAQAMSNAVQKAATTNRVDGAAPVPQAEQAPAQPSAPQPE